VYVAAWVVGLLLAPAAPASTAPAGEVHAYYAGHAAAILVQSLVVHGVAGVALAVLAAALPVVARAHVPVPAPGAGRPNGRLESAVRLLGWSAAGVSLLQVAFAVVATRDVAATAPGTVRGLFQAINVADTGKLLLLAGFVAAATALASRAGLAPGWVRALAVVLTVLLPLGGASFLLPAGVLTAMLVASLPLLLVWVGATAVLSWRR
jgi:hypothetical protein